MSIQKSKTMLVSDVMTELNRVPIIKEDVILKGTLKEMGRSRLGIFCIVDAGSKLFGILTGGDIRRKLIKVRDPLATDDSGLLVGMLHLHPAVQAILGKI